MKTLRRIGIIAIVVMALAFTACDDILEVFYPEFASGEGVDFGIGIWIQIEVPADQVTGDPQLAGRLETTWGEVIEGSERFVYPEWIFDEAGNLLLQGFLEFGVKDPGEYRVPIWLETQDNEWPDFDEPQTVARWQPDPANDPDFWDDIFRFETGTEMFWINGEAIFGGVERLNYNFRLRNAIPGGDAFVIQASSIGIRQYSIETINPDLLYVDRTWRLINPARELESPPRDIVVAESWEHYPDGVSNELFNIDFSDAAFDPAPVTYYLEVELFYMDGGWAFTSRPVRVIFQEFAGAPYTLTVNVHETDWDPLRLDSLSSYGVFIQEITQGVGVQSEYWLGSQVSPVAGSVSIQVTGLVYNPTEPVDPEIDFIRVYLDVVEPDTIGPGDWMLVIPIGLASGETEIVLDYSGWMMVPVFDVVPTP